MYTAPSLRFYHKRVGLFCIRNRQRVFAGVLLMPNLLLLLCLQAFPQYSVDAIPIQTEHPSVNQQHSSYTSPPADSRCPFPTSFHFSYLSYSSSTFHPQVIGHIPPVSSSPPLAAWRSLSASLLPFYYYFACHHPTMCSMIFNTDHS